MCFGPAELHRYPVPAQRRGGGSRVIYMLRQPRCGKEIDTGDLLFRIPHSHINRALRLPNYLDRGRIDCAMDCSNSCIYFLFSPRCPYRTLTPIGFPLPTHKKTYRITTHHSLIPHRLAIAPHIAACTIHPASILTVCHLHHIISALHSSPYMPGEGGTHPDNLAASKHNPVVLGNHTHVMALHPQPFHGSLRNAFLQRDPCNAGVIVASNLRRSGQRRVRGGGRKHALKCAGRRAPPAGPSRTRRD